MGPTTNNVLDQRVVNIFLSARESLLADLSVLLTAETRNTAAEAQLISKIAGITSELKVKFDIRAQIRLREEYIIGSSFIPGGPELNEINRVLSSLEVADQAQYLGQQINAQLGTLHTEAVVDLIGQTTGNMQERLDGVSRNVEQVIREFNKKRTLEALAESIVRGDAFQQQKQEVIEGFLNQGIVLFRDRSGRAWDLARYADTIVRTDTAVAYNRGTVNRAIEAGFNLLERVESVDCCPDICEQHRGEIRDLNTQGDPPDVYHPNCRGYRIIKT